MKWTKFKKSWKTNRKNFYLKFLLPIAVAILVIAGLVVGLPLYYRSENEGIKTDVSINILNPQFIKETKPADSQYDYNLQKYNNNYLRYWSGSDNVPKMVKVNYDYQKTFDTSAVTLGDLLDEWNEQKLFGDNNLFKFGTKTLFSRPLNFYLKPVSERNNLPTSQWYRGNDFSLTPKETHFLTIMSNTNPDSKDNNHTSDQYSKYKLDYVTNSGIDDLYLKNNDSFSIIYWSST